MQRYPPPEPRSFSPLWARLLIAVGIVAFLVLVMSHAAQSAVLRPGYYHKVLEDENAYDRAYNELSTDPTLQPFSLDLLGGVQVPFIGAIPGLLQQVIAPELLQTVTEAAITNLIEYLKDHDRLRLTIDVTEFVEGVPGFGIATAGTLIGETPLKPSEDMDDFKDSLEDLIDGISGRGSLPAELPVYDVPQDRRGEVVDLIVTRSGAQSGPFTSLGLQAEVEAAIQAGSMQEAVNAVLPPLLAEVSSNAALDLKNTRYIQETEQDGETRYLLGPPPETVKKIEDGLWAVQLISSNSYWMRPVAAVLFLAALAGIAYLTWGDGRVLSLRLGIVLAAAGLIGALGWLIAMPILQGVVIDAAFEGGRVPSAAFDDLARDVLRRAVANLTPYIWIPSFIAAGAGIALLVASRTAFARPAR